MGYPQDLINKAYHIAKQHLNHKAQINESLSPRSLINILHREEIPEPLAREVADNY
ncbi:MAG: hypothetical protein OER04_02420 [Cyclobacteriaceae bacterium]|nr:hypothetical protein [Cyclobacteriaceae bacterium]